MILRRHLTEFRSQRCNAGDVKCQGALKSAQLAVLSQSVLKPPGGQQMGHCPLDPQVSVGGLHLLSVAPVLVMNQ